MGEGREKLFNRDPDRVEFTEKVFSQGWGDRNMMPMRNYLREFLSDDSLGVSCSDDKLTIHIGCLFLKNFSTSEKFRSIEEMIEAGWLVD